MEDESTMWHLNSKAKLNKMYVTRHAVSSPYFQLLVSVYQKKKKSPAWEYQASWTFYDRGGPIRRSSNRNKVCFDFLPQVHIMLMSRLFCPYVDNSQYIRNSWAINVKLTIFFSDMDQILCYILYFITILYWLLLFLKNICVKCFVACFEKH